MESRLIKVAWIRGLVWFLVASMAAPPALFAQGLGGFPGPQTTEPQTTRPQFTVPQMGGQQTLEQPVVTDPTALKPLSPAQVSCPQPEGKPQIILHQWVMGPQPFPQAGQGQQSGVQVGPGQQGLPPGVPGQQFGFQGGEGQSGIFQGEELSIEEGFARFFVLQGITSRLKQFGYNFFEFPVSSFAPVMDVPVGPDYVIGPDDTLAIYIWNVPDAKFNRNYIVPVGRDGMIFVPNVGTIPVAGQTFSEANRLIMARLGSLLKRFQAHVSMARLRTIKVYVVGEVVRPGAYEVSSLASASNAIYAACGPAKSGSLRQIRIVRDGKVIAELDFYNFLLRGDRSKDVRLQSGDAILIPPTGKLSAIGGPVRRPAIYELTGKTTLAELIELAGGLAPTADRRSCHIFRIQADQNRVILDVDLGKALTQRDEKANGSAGNDPHQGSRGSGLPE